MDNDSVNGKTQRQDQISATADGKIILKDGNDTVILQAYRCFPWSAPDSHISLRDAKGKERLLAESLDELPSDVRKAVEVSLQTTSFVIEIESVVKVVTEFEIRNWHVITNQGKRTFQTKLDEWPIAVPGGRYLIKDVSGDLYQVPSPKSLDSKSRDVLWSFVD